jgi:hypothetical protein
VSSIRNIHNQVAEYNETHEEADRIKFIHGGSSAVLSFIGREISVSDEKQVLTRRIIPKALLPFGILRKRYGVYPFSGEMEIGAFNYGSRKAGINHKFLSGMDATFEGLETVYEYANNSKRPCHAKLIHQSIISLIEHMSHHDFVRSLKMLLMQMTNIMLIADDGAYASTEYFDLLQHRREALRTIHPGDNTIDSYFDKYVPRLKNIMAGRNLPFKADDSFRNDMLRQYPVIFCSTVSPDDFSDGIPDEKIFRGELNLDTVKMLFTPSPFVEDLQVKLTKAGLSRIPVIGYQTSRKFEYDDLNVKNSIRPNL